MRQDPGGPGTQEALSPRAAGPRAAGSPVSRILLVEDTPEDAAYLKVILEDGYPGRFAVQVTDTLRDALSRVSPDSFDAVILDLCLPDSMGLATLERLQARTPSLPILVLTGLQDEITAQESIRQGAQDYLVKGTLDGAIVSRAICYAIERKRTENALRRSEERFDLLSRATNDAVWDWNLKTQRVTWNVGVRAFLDYPPEHVGTDIEWWRSQIHADDRPRVVEGIRGVLENGGYFWHDEYRYRCASGDYAFIADRAYVLRDDEGRPLRMIGAMMDVTDRRRAEDALLESNTTLRTLVQASPLAIAVAGPDRKLRLWNPAAERLFGWNESGVLGRPFPAVSRSEADGLPALLDRTLRGESVTAAELSCVRRDGTEVDVSLSTAPLVDVRSGILGAMAVASDVTERRSAETRRLQLEDQLRKSQKMEAVGRLAGGIAHDFNNLLTAISGYAELLQGGFAVGDARRDHAEEILRSSGRATTLTRQLLAFSRRQVLQPRPLNVNSVIQGIDGLLRRLIGEHAELSMKLDPRLGLVKADQGQLEQVIINLTLNARDALAASGGHVSFETREVELGPEYVSRHGRERAGRHVMLAVSDTGCGMDKATLSHMFEPFFTTKELGKGTGLGLATVYGIVKQSGGDIWVYSEPGIGSIFKIYLPLSEEADRPRLPADVDPKPPRQVDETVLLVEDTEVIRRLLREVLTRRGYHVLLAANGEEALDVAAAHAGPIHLLISDVIMPRLNGRELARRLCPVRPDMSVLFMSGYTEDAIAKHGILDPGTHFLEKPFTHGALMAKIREILDARST